MVGMSHEAIDILMHVVANVRIGNCASVMHYATHVITLDEFKVAGGRGIICMDGEAIRDAERVSVFQNRNAAGDRTDKSLIRTAEFMYHKVCGTFVIAKVNMHFFSITLQAGQVRPAKGMLLLVKIRKILANKSDGSARARHQWQPHSSQAFWPIMGGSMGRRTAGC